MEVLFDADGMPYAAKRKNGTVLLLLTQIAGTNWHRALTSRGDIVTIQDADLELDPIEYLRLIVPIQEGRADVVYGSRFMNQGLVEGKKGRLSFYLANRGLAALTNVLYGSNLTDIETCYKVFRRDVLSQITLRASRFEIEPEVTAQLLKNGFRILELPIGYTPRTHDEGKKISWRDGFTAIYTLLNQRLKP